jgi:glycosyltransferase involved in cell wall biosynthesis
MKDSFIVVSPPMGEVSGWATHAHSIISTLQTAGFSVHLQPTQSQKPTFLERLLLVSRGSLKSYVIIADAVKSLLYLLFYRPSVVIVIVEPLACSYSLLRYLFKFRLVLFCAGTYAQKLASSLSWLHVLPFYKSDTVLSVSEYTSNQLLRHLPGSAITVLPLGYSPTSYFRDPLIAKNKGQILFVGNCKRRKGLKVLLDALSLLHVSVVSSLSLLIVGRFTPYKMNQIKDQYIHLFGVCNIVFLGSVPESQLRLLYQTSIVHVIPSVNDNDAFEGFGLPHIDAIACGTLTIGSLGCGNETAIQEGNGLLVEQESPLKLSQAISDVLSRDNISPTGPLPFTWSDHVDLMLSYIFGPYREIKC